MRLSVLDVGSNTVHLLLLDVYPGSRPEPYASHKMALRLVDYQDDDGRITDEGRDVFADQLSRSGPASWDDDNFDVHFAFFSRASAEVRLRILEGRRLRLQERLERSREQARDSRSTRDSYIAELFRHDVESTEREVGWVNELIEIERKAVADPRPLSSEV